MRAPELIQRLGLLAMISVFLSTAGAITLQIPTRQTEFPLSAETYQKVGVVVAWGDNSSGQTSLPPYSSPFGVENPGAGYLTNIVQVAGGDVYSLALQASGNDFEWGYQPSIYGYGGGGSIIQVAAGSQYSIALSRDFTVSASGTFESNIPAQLTNIVQISAGGAHFMALQSDGSVVAWGSNTCGQTTVPVGLANVVQVAAGGNHSLALQSDGSVVAWGDNTYGQTTVPVGLANVVQVAAGGNHSLALQSDGTVVAWGDNTYGQTTVPVGLTNVVQVAAGAEHSVALQSDGTLVAWGDNTYGQTNVPSGLIGVFQVAAGSYHTLALEGGPLDQTISAFNPISTQTNGVSFFITTPTTSSGLPVSLSVLSGPAEVNVPGLLVPYGNGISGPTPLLDSSVTPTGEGTVVLAVNQEGNTNYNPAPQVTISFTVVAANQTINLGATQTDQIVGIPFTLSPSTTSGLPVSLSIKSGPASVSGDTITPTGIGTVVVAADQVGDTDYNAAPEVTATFTVKDFNQSIAPFGPIPLKKFPCDSFSVAIPKSTSKLPVTLSVLSGPAKVTGNRVSITSAGVVVLAANQSGNPNYNPSAQVTTSFTVLPKNPNQKIAPFQKIPNKSHLSTFTINTPKSSSGLPVTVTVKSGNAYINGNAVTLTGTGYVELAADQSGNSYFNEAPEVTTKFDVK